MFACVELGVGLSDVWINLNVPEYSPLTILYPFVCSPDHVVERSNAVRDFDLAVTANLSQLEAAVTAMSSSQLANLTAVKDTLQQSALEHRVKVRTDVQGLSSSITEYISKALHEFGQNTGDRALASAEKASIEMAAASATAEAQKDEIKILVADGRAQSSSFRAQGHDELMATKANSTQSAFDVSQVSSCDVVCVIVCACMRSGGDSVAWRRMGAISITPRL